MWELYDLSKDFSQADDLAAEEPEKLAEMKALFLARREANKAFPIGGGQLAALPSRGRRLPARTQAGGSTRRPRRMPEFAAPGLGKRSNHVAIDVEVGEEATGVLYAWAAPAAGWPSTWTRASSSTNTTCSHRAEHR